MEQTYQIFQKKNYVQQTGQERVDFGSLAGQVALKIIFSPW